MSYRFVPDKYDMYAVASRMTTLDGLPVMEVRLTSPERLGRGREAIAQKVPEPTAPIFYRQKWIEFARRQIAVVKFRSMIWKYCTGAGRKFETADDAFIAMGRAELVAEFQLNQKIADDPRVSKLGAFMRRTSLDELPQLFNALRGDLSLVGLGQIYGRSSTTCEERVKLDVYYVENWSLSMDVSILARALVNVAARNGAG